MYGMFYNPLFLIITLPALLLAMWAQWRVQSAYRKYSQVRNYTGMTGAEVARRVLDFNGLQNVQIEPVQGFLTDHYDPRKKILRLSPEVYSSPSVAAAGIAAHESGHAIQDREGYLAMQARSAMVPTVQLGSWLGPIVFILGILMMPILGTTLAWIGVALFAGTALFAIVTLPVEFNASQRAKQSLVAQGIIGQQEMAGVNKVLDAAAMTYVAGAAQAISTLLYYVLILSGMGGRRRG
jgi:Zn-dependent membrane protease YugP